MLQGEHSAILSTFTKLPFVILIFVLSIFTNRVAFYTGFTVMGKFKKNVTVQFSYPHALNMEYFDLDLSLKGVF